MANLNKKYENLRTVTITLTLALLLILALSIVSFYKGWLGAPGKVYFSPDENQYYVRCGEDPSVCGALGTCQEITIITSTNNYKDDVCVPN